MKPKNLIKILRMTHFQKVGDFMKTAGQRVETTHQTNIFNDNPKMVAFRYDLIDEEFKELQAAIKDHNFVEIVDALGDLLYVIYGFGHCIGVNLDRLLLSVTKDSKESHFESIGKSMAMYNLVSLDNAKQPFPEKTITLSNPDLVHKLLDMFNDVFTLLRKSISNQGGNVPNFTLLVECLVELLYQVYVFGQCIGVNLDKAFDIVHDSNMTKFCTTEREAKETVDKYMLEYKEGNNKYNSPTYRVYNSGGHEQKGLDYFVVYNKSSGKILKNKNYIPVDFRSLF